MNNKTPNIYFHKFVFHLETLEDMQLPEYKGSLFRGAFGTTFRKVVCITKQKTCEGCLLAGQCSYFKIYETELPQNALPFLRNVKKVPHPFIIDPPLELKRTYKKGEELKVGLTIFGDTINAFPFFVYTFMKLGETGISYKRSKVELVNVAAISVDGKEFSIFTNGNLKTDYIKISAQDVMGSYEGKTNKVFVELLTPLRIQEEGNIIHNPARLTPQFLLSLIERRITVVANLFCGATETEFAIPCNHEKVTIKERNLFMNNWERYSSRQQTKMSLGGLQGTFSLEGEVSRLVPYLKLASYLNLGKNTVFGLGRMKLIMNYEL